MTEPDFIPLEFKRKNPQEMMDASMAFYHEIKHRRTVRQFSQRPVPIEVIKNAIRSAGTAPSGANRQPWHFVVVTDPGTKRKIRLAAENEERSFYSGRAPKEWLDALQHLGTDENKPFLESAPALIVIFAQKFTKDNNGNQLKNYYVNESVGIATGILITALHFSGLATLTHTPSPMKFLNSILNRPDDERPFLILVTGFPADDAVVPDINKYTLDQVATFM